MYLEFGNALQLAGATSLREPTAFCAHALVMLLQYKLPAIGGSQILFEEDAERREGAGFPTQRKPKRFKIEGFTPKRI
jgi:hypothetical protein